jgi:DNA-binding MarR family transcriptional regulator
MRLLFHDLKLALIQVMPRYNLVMSSTPPNPATELRESIMALTRQLRRHRSDNGLTLSQQQVLGEVSRAGVTTPAELATRMHVRVQSLTDGINHLESRGLVARRTDDDDRRRQLIEVTPEGMHLLERDRAERDAWLNSAMRETLTELEFDLLMLVAPVLRKLADGNEPDERQSAP